MHLKFTQLPVNRSQNVILFICSSLNNFKKQAVDYLMNGEVVKTCGVQLLTGSVYGTLGDQVHVHPSIHPSDGDALKKKERAFLKTQVIVTWL